MKNYYHNCCQACNCFPCSCFNPILIPGPKGETGPAGPSGPTGLQGIQGEQGPTGADGPITTMLALSAVHLTGGTVAVTTAGVPITLETKPYLSGFTADAANQRFTVLTAGTYLLSYDIKVDSPQTLLAAIIINTSALLTSIATPHNGATMDHYTATVIRTLAVNDVLSLQIASDTPSSIRLQDGNSASLTAVRISS